MPNLWNWLTRRADAPREVKALALTGFVGLGEASWSRRSFPALAQEGFARNPIVHRCVRLIAEAATRVPLRATEDGRRLDDHPLLKLITRPNPRQSGSEMLEGVYAYLQLAGNSYLAATIAGPVTLGALKARIAAAGVAGLIVALCDGRLNFLQRLAIFATFGRGWSRRVAEIRASALAMAGASPPQPPERTTDMTFLSGYKTYIVAAAMAIFAIAGLLGVDIPSFEGHAPGGLLMEALAIIFLRQGVKNDIGNA